MRVLILFVAIFFAKNILANEYISTSEIIANAKNEGFVEIYSVLSNKAAAPLIKKFKELFPEIEVKYSGDQGTTETNNKFIEEFNANNNHADVIWSSAVDLQIKLAIDGYAMNHQSKQAKYLPSWAKFRDLVWGSTFEPIVLVYNKNLVNSASAPKSHIEFAQYLNKNRATIAKKVVLFDPDKSGAGLFFLAQDLAIDANAISLYEALGNAQAQTSAGTGEMLTKINSGEYLFGYNIIGSYALSRSKSDLPNLEIIYPNDYTPVISRGALISKKAPHPNAAKLWIDFLLSQEGQRIIANEIKLNAIREDINSDYTADTVTKKIGASATKPLALNASLIKHLQNTDNNLTLIKLILNSNN